MSLLQNSNAISSGGYDINSSLRFRTAATSYLLRTPTSTTNRQTWTWSGWIKRGVIGVRQHIFVSANPVVNTGGQQELQFAFDSSNRIEITGGVSGVGQDLNLTTTQVFRDPSAWYHLVILMDTTQATSSNRIKFYVNGVQVTTFTTAIYPAQNHNTAVNLINFSNRIGGSGGSYLDGYQAEINLIDGQALTPSSFGETDAVTGSWVAKKYTGTYGTNGFYLKFSDIATTSGSNAGLGKDFSGNTNYWTTNNISVTAGTTYDAMIDSPTLTSATVANYCTWNPLNSFGSAATISNGNLNIVTPTANGGTTLGTIAVSSGKWYWEVIPSNQPTFIQIGIVSTTIALAAYLESMSTALYYIDGYKGTGPSGSITAYGPTIANGDVLGVALDMDNGKIWWSKNGTWMASGDPVAGTNAAFTGISGTYAPAIGDSANSITTTSSINFGQRPFAYTPPTGFVALNTYNLPDSTIKKGNKYMDATLWTGTATGAGANTITITNQAGFKPDFVWAKARGIGYSNGLFNSVMGVNRWLSSNSTISELVNEVDGYLTSFNSNGFTLSNGSNSNLTFNSSPHTYVAWQWQAGQGTNTTNTAGTITSTVSVNATAGFSVVTWTANGVNGATVGHGLGVAPKMIIVKCRSNTQSWPVYHTTLGNTKYLMLNSTAAEVANIGMWNNTSPTSTVFTTGDSGFLWSSGFTYVAYCWSEIAGFSKFGSYTGNGSTNGPFIYLGFRPKYLMVKRTNDIGEWGLHDTARDTYNTVNKVLFAHASDAEVGSIDFFDFTANGFKIRSSNDNRNASGSTYIYAAFAENPFKNANAR